MKKRCECMENATLKWGMEDWYDEKKELPFVTHRPNECKCKNNIKQYIRGGKKIWLCSNCCLESDKVVKGEGKE